jgi:hypothetical protein
MWVPYFTHIFPVVLKVNLSDAAIGEKEVVKHVSCSCVSESIHVIVKNFKVHWLKCRDNLFFQCLLHSCSGSEDAYSLLPTMTFR